jgi:hypothetical protein
VAYKLQLPEGMKMHNVFHVILLKRYITGTGKVIPPPPPELMSGHLEYALERVIDHDPKSAGAIWSRGLATAMRATLGSQKGN